VLPPVTRFVPYNSMQPTCGTRQNPAVCILIFSSQFNSSPLTNEVISQEQLCMSVFVLRGLAA
jgi:hypothetical protein